MLSEEVESYKGQLKSLKTEMEEQVKKLGFVALTFHFSPIILTYSFAGAYFENPNKPIGEDAS